MYRVVQFDILINIKRQLLNKINPLMAQPLFNQLGCACYGQMHSPNSYYKHDASEIAY